MCLDYVNFHGVISYKFVNYVFVDVYIWMYLYKYVYVGMWRFMYM